MPLNIDIFGSPKALVGMVHVGALPGTPRHETSIAEIADRAASEARLLAEAGFDAIVIENMHDVPYLMRRVGPEIVSSMTVSAQAVRAAVEVPVGVQVLAGANDAAIAVAHAAACDFVRCEGFVYASVADEGVFAEADAGPLLRYRRAIGADGSGPSGKRIHVLADIKKKHNAHAITSDVDLAETARTAEFCRADGVIVTGVATGRPTSVNDLRTVRQATKLPMAVGSGARPETLQELFAYADAVIVGSWYKQGGSWSSPPDPERVRDLVSAAERARL
ncbi:MAG: BtpA/SgcQ family protein [Planctomycetota bacterium]